jgi:hypothetical protein
MTSLVGAHPVRPFQAPPLIVASRRRRLTVAGRLRAVALPAIIGFVAATTAGSSVVVESAPRSGAGAGMGAATAESAVPGASVPGAPPATTANGGVAGLPGATDGSRPADEQGPAEAVGPGTASSVAGGAGSAAGPVAAEQAKGDVTTPEDFGARGDGVHDDTVALQKAFDAVPTGGTLELRPGADYLHSDVLTLTTPDVTVDGREATLTATKELRSAVHIDTDSVTVSGATLRLATSTQRFHAYEQMKLRISGDGVVVRDVHIQGAAAAGVYVGNGSANFLLERVTVADTRADGIHITGGSHDGRVVDPVTTGTGDDGVAVVSYQADGVPSARIRIISPTVNGTTWGRGISVVGGTDIVYSDVTIRDSDAAGIYVGSEGAPYWTFPSENVLVDGGTVTGANSNADKDHGAVIVYAGNAGTRTSDVTVQGLTISGTRTSASWDVGVVADPGAEVEGVTLSGLDISDGSSTSAFYTNRPAAVRLEGVRRDGAAVPDRLGG